MNAKRIGILSAGGDCPGINAAIRGLGKAAILKYGMSVYGISSGYNGLLKKDVRELDLKELSGILTLGGTILGTSREKPFKKNKNPFDFSNKPKEIIENYKQLKLDCVVCIGGNGTQKTAYQLSEIGINVIGIPKTIDNDIWGTDVSFGFDSAINIATEAIDRIHTTANSHNRTIVIEVMGHHTGWLALYAGLAGGADMILIPEIPYDENVISAFIEKRYQDKKKYSIIVVAEGINSPDEKYPGEYIAKRLNELTAIETRCTILGYLQRGGSPSPSDRILATQFGYYAAEMIYKGEYGKMVSITNSKFCSIPLKTASSKIKTIPANHPMIQRARDIGTSFGDQI